MKTVLTLALVAALGACATAPSPATLERRFDLLIAGRARNAELCQAANAVAEAKLGRGDEEGWKDWRAIAGPYCLGLVEG